MKYWKTSKFKVWKFVVSLKNTFNFTCKFTLQRPYKNDMNIANVTLGTKLKCHSEKLTSPTEFAFWKNLSAERHCVALDCSCLSQEIKLSQLCWWQYYDVSGRILMRIFWDVGDPLSLINRYVSNDHWVLKLCHHYRFLQHLWSASM